MRKTDKLYWRYQIWIVIVSLIITYALSYTTIYNKIENYFNDTIQYFASDEKYFTESVVVDINDNSLKILEKEFGHWPYTRDKYASVIEFLESMNVKNIVFDIKFLDPRIGDDIFRKTIKNYNNIFFVTNALQDDIQINDEEKERLKKMALNVNSDIPALKYNSLLLPHLNVFDIDTIYKFGITSVLEDKDNYIRSIPLLYNINSNIFPSLLLRIQSLDKNIPKIEYNAKTNELSMDNKTWNVDEKNRIKLFYPQNANSIITIPFYKISEVALNKKTIENKSFLKDKTVFIGSSAFLSDRVNTPRGAMSGSYLLAIAYESLKHNLIIKNSDIVNIFLLIIAIIFSIYLSSRKEIYKKSVIVISLLTIIATIIYGFISLKLFYIESNVFFCIFLIVCSIVVTAIKYQFSLSNYNKKLINETKRLYNEANCDTLTGLLNRRGFNEQYKKYKELINTKTSQSSCIAIIDLDHFKSVNDTYGHDIGDLVLQKFANLLKEQLRDIDIPSRWGGEEFIILLRNTTIDESIIVLNRLRQQCEEMDIQTPQGVLNVTISIGVTQIKDYFQTIDLYVKEADMGLYQAKETGRNQVCIA